MSAASGGNRWTFVSAARAKSTLGRSPTISSTTPLNSVYRRVPCQRTTNPCSHVFPGHRTPAARVSTSTFRERHAAIQTRPQRQRRVPPVLHQCQGRRRLTQLASPVRDRQLPYSTTGPPPLPASPPPIKQPHLCPGNTTAHP